MDNRDKGADEREEGSLGIISLLTHPVLSKVDVKAMLMVVLPVQALYKWG